MLARPADVPRVPRKLREADLSRVRAVFTDVDGTLNTGGILESSTIRALEDLAAAKIPVVLVSGRPSGWGDCWVRTLPVAGVITENGALYYTREGGRIRKVYLQPDEERQATRKQLKSAVAGALRHVPGSKLSADSLYREVDLAISDFAEEVKLAPDAPGRLETILRAKGIQAVRSSIHVNFWIGEFNKLAAVKMFCAQEWDLQLKQRDNRIAYAGDSFNDAPMFAALPLSVGVANVKDVLATIDAPPAFITRGREGAGFRELARAVLQARKG